MHPNPNPCRLPKWRITERDPAIIGEVLRWQQLTTNQIAHWFFASSRTAGNRIAVLLQMGYLKTIDIPWRASALVTATAKGARARADLGLRPRASEPGRLLHDLTVVQVAAWMLDQDPLAGWITERELLRDELTAARDQDGRLRRGPGRRPDGVLVRANHRQEAVEVELTPKRDRTEYDRKLSWYLGQCTTSECTGSPPASACANGFGVSPATSIWTTLSKSPHYHPDWTIHQASGPIGTRPAPFELDAYS